VDEFDDGVQNIPDAASASAIAADARVQEAAHAVGCILEGLGYSVYARIVPLDVVGDLLGGTVRLAWRKLRPYIEEERQRGGSQKTFEWFQCSLHNWNDIHREKRACRSVRTKPIATGSRECGISFPSRSFFYGGGPVSPRASTLRFHRKSQNIQQWLLI
jgi:hypothetical protein